MKARRLPEHTPSAAPACASCSALAAQLEIPSGPAADGDGAQQVCYLCAHYHTAHGAEVAAHGMIGALDRGVCRCSRSEIYPADEIFRRDSAALGPEVRALRAEASRLEGSALAQATRQAEEGADGPSSAVRRFEGAVAELRDLCGDREAELAVYRILAAERRRRSGSAGVDPAGLEATEEPQADPDRLARVVRLGQKREFRGR